jgi:hypothetical protein
MRQRFEVLALELRSGAVFRLRDQLQTIEFVNAHLTAVRALYAAFLPVYRPSAAPKIAMNPSGDLYDRRH